MSARGFVGIARKLDAASDKAKHILAIQMAKDTDPYVPARSKALANDTKVIGDTIIYRGPYARFLYYGKLMIDPNTGSSWAPYGASKVVTGKDLNISQAVHGKAQSHWFEASKAQNLQKWIRVAERAINHEFGQ